MAPFSTVFVQMCFERAYTSPLQSLYGYAAFIKCVFNLVLNDSRDIG